jgi:hypothetical protein
MRLPRVRFTVRQMMIVVAIAGIALGAGQLWRRRTLHLEQARLERKREMACERTIRLISLVRRGQWPYEPTMTFGVGLPDGGSLMIRSGRISHSDDQEVWRDVDLNDRETMARWSAMYQRAAGHYADSARRYDRADRYPWLPVELGPSPKNP